MAYKRLITRVCQVCKRRASWEVFNNQNAPYGYFCTKCANYKVKRLTAEEKKYEN